MGKGWLKLVSDKPSKPKKTYSGEPLECKCGSRATIEVRLGRTIKGGKLSAGQKQVRCAMCGDALWG